MEEFQGVTSRAKGMLYDWRDGRASTPRAADYGIQVLKRVLALAYERGAITANPAEGIKTLYQNDRSELIVSSAEMEAILAHLTPEASLAIRLAAATALRRGDLRALRWKHVERDYIAKPTGKSGGRTTAMVPIIPEVRALLEEAKANLRASGLTQCPETPVLVNSYGRPWGKDSLTQAFARAAKTAGVIDRDLHDLRGTAATRLLKAGCSTAQVALMLGWEESKVMRIMKRYVSGPEVVLDMARKLEGVAG